VHNGTYFISKRRGRRERRERREERVTV
jgi:hypothetical protein